MIEIKIKIFSKKKQYPFRTCDVDVKKMSSCWAAGNSEIVPGPVQRKYKPPLGGVKSLGNSWDNTLPTYSSNKELPVAPRGYKKHFPNMKCLDVLGGMLGSTWWGFRPFCSTLGPSACSSVSCISCHLVFFRHKPGWVVFFNHFGRVIGASY